MLAVAAGWIGLIAVVLAIGFSAVRYRQEISVIWPQSAGRLFQPGPEGECRMASISPMSIITAKMRTARWCWRSRGNIVNSGSRELPVPQNVRVTLSDASNHELYHWSFTPNVQTLKPGQSSPFLTRLSSPPAAARHLEVRFAPNG